MPSKLIEIQYLSKNEYPLWDEFVQNSLQGTFFCSIKWVQILENVNRRPLKLLVCKRNNEIVAGIPFFENKKWFWKLITPVFLMPCDGPLFIHNPDAKPQKVIADQIDFLQQMLSRLNNEYNLIQLKTHHSLNDLRAFTWNDFQIAAEHTYICKIENEQTILSRFNQSLRKKIQKAKDQNMLIYESDDLNTFSDLYFSSYKRHCKIPPISKENFELLIQNILKIKNVNMYFVKKEEKILAARIILKDKDTIYDLLAGSSDESGLASSFLVAEIMRMHAGEFSNFDFMGADHPDIEQFKRAFGGDLIHRFRVQNMPGIILNLLFRIHQNRELNRRKI
jgi:hypothetical protein